MTPDAGARRELLFKSRWDLWLVALLSASVLTLFVVAVTVWWVPSSLALRAGLSALCAVSGAFTLWLMVSTDYRVGEHELRLRTGPFRWTIPLGAIVSVTPSRNPLSSPAGSLDRLHIRYRGSSFGILISPESKAEFLRALANRNPALTLSGDRLVRERAEAD